MSARKIRVAIVSDHELHARGLRQIINSSDRAETVGVAPTGHKVVSDLNLMRPDIILIDAGEEQTVTTALTLKRHIPETTLVAVTPPLIGSSALQYARAGVVGFVEGSASADELLNALTRVIEHGCSCSPGVAKLLLHHVSRVASNPAPKDLTRRESEILILLEQGLSNREIASALSIALATTKNHVHSILEKLEVQSRHDVVRVFPYLRNFGSDTVSPVVTQPELRSIRGAR